MEWILCRGAQRAPKNARFGRMLCAPTTCAATLVCLLLLASLAHAAPLAILTDVRGEVSIVRGGQTLPGKTGAALSAGDAVRAAAGSATIYFANRAPQTLQAGQQVKIAADGKAGAPSLWHSVYSGVAAGFARRDENIGATVRGGGPKFASVLVALLSPVNSRTLGNRPLFFWALDGAASDFEVTVRDPQGNVVWQVVTTEKQMECPAQPALQAGVRYSWDVLPRQRDANGAVVPLDEKKSLTRWFEVTSSAEVKEMLSQMARLNAELKDAPESVRRTAQAAATAESGFHDAAIADLTDRTLEIEAARGTVQDALAKHDAVVAALDEAGRLLLRRLYLDTRQIPLAARIAPGAESKEPAASEVATP